MHKHIQPNGHQVKASGFTLIEIMIVVVVIGILVAITVVGYGNWRRDTTRQALSSDLQTAANSLEQEKNFGNRYPARLPDTYDGMPLQLRVSPDGGRFCVEGAVAGSTQHWDSSAPRAQEGGCPALTP